MAKHLSRRRFIQLGAVTGLSLYFGLPRMSAFAALASPRKGSSGLGGTDNPLLDISGPFSSTVFNGDDVRRPHKLLWDVEGYIRSKGGRPTTFREESVVVVGGGMAGLLSGYFLRDLKPVILEQALQFGGNSKGERFEGSAYALGAAYITVPDAGSPVDKFLQETGLDKHFRLEEEKDTRVLFHGVKDLWNGQTDPAALDSAKIIQKEFERVFETAYPEIPWSEGDPLSLAQLKEWDKETAIQWLRRVDPKLHPHVEEFFQLYAWSSFGGSLDEISAAQFANFVTAETVGVRAFPGGNAFITNTLLEKLRAQLPAENLAVDSLVLEVKEVPGGVEVLYEDQEKNLRLIHAKAAVMAAPKYVARAIVKGGGTEREDIWKRLDYRAYIVINVLLKQKVKSPAYDLYCLEGTVPGAPRFGEKKRPWSDLIFAGWAEHDETGRSILTLYKPLPYEGGKSTIVDDNAHNRFREEAEAALPAQLKDFGIPVDAIEGMRITRWGHAIPLAGVGLINDGTVEKISAPIGRIEFANQDNFMNPAFETSFTTAARAADGVRRSLRA